MNWIILTQLIILCFLSLNQDKLKSTVVLRLSWHWLLAIFFTQAAFTLFRMGGPSLSVEMWANGITWLCLGMSIFQLPYLLLGEDKTLSTTTDTWDDISKSDNSTDETQ
ncbi:MAG: hypothetical protein ACJAR1_002767 [Rubritalea sp.]|jgi:hypothetical protein